MAGRAKADCEANLIKCSYLLNLARFALVPRGSAMTDEAAQLAAFRFLAGPFLVLRLLREWHTKNLGRLPGLKFMRTLWVCNVSGGPFQYTATKPGATTLGLEDAH